MFHSGLSYLVLASKKELSMFVRIFWEELIALDIRQYGELFWFSAWPSEEMNQTNRGKTETLISKK